MVLFLLNRLHEDLIQKNNKTDAIDEKEQEKNSSKYWIQKFKRKQKSIISDIFLGVLKKTYTCENCKNGEIFYEPFFHLSLDIPETKNNKVKFKVFPNNYEFNYFNVEIFEVTNRTMVKDIKKKIKESKDYIKKEFDAVLFKNKSIECVLADTDTIYDYIYTKIDFADEEFIDYEILFYEVEISYQSKNKGDFVTFYVTPSVFFEEKYLYFYCKKFHRAITYPKAFSISKKSRVKDLYIEIYKYYRRIMDDKIVKEDENKIDTSYYKNFYQNINNREFIERDFDNNYLKLDSLNDTDNTDRNNLNTDDTDNSEKLFELYFFNNIPTPYNFFSFKPSCEFCKKKCNFCKVNFSLSSTIYELYATHHLSREFLILADFTKFKENCHKFYEEIYDKNDVRNSLKGDFTIYDCLDNLTNEEMIIKEKEKEIEWKCQGCKSKKSEAYRKIDILSLPKCLIIQIKRFKFRGYTSLMDLVNNKKKDNLIDFPINNLELGSFLNEISEKKMKYELFAISVHSGSIKAGTFSSVVRNRGEWHEINDDAISKVDISDFVDPKAYLLFYRSIDETTNISLIDINSINEVTEKN